MSRDNQGLAFKKPQAELEAFIQGVSDAPPEPTSLSSARKPRKKRPRADTNTALSPRGAIYQRSDGQQARKRSIYVPVDLDRRFATFCASRGLKVGPTVAHAMQLFLDDQGPSDG